MASALGLGRLAVQSALGEPLRAEIDISSLTAEEASTLKPRVASTDTYRAAGVDYNPALAAATVSLQRRDDGRPYLRVTSDRVVQEPFVDVILELDWSSGKLVREFTLLIDPPASTRVAAAPPPVAPLSIGAAPTSVPAPAPRPAAEPPAPTPVPAPVATAPARSASAPSANATPRRQAPPAAAVAAAPAASAEMSVAVHVQKGDTLYRIASREQQPGVSLDQLLVSLYRNNPDAFVDNNMNRLKAGSVLTVPTRAESAEVSPAEARQIIQAQSADFGAYRQKLAQTVRTAPAAESGRSATGKVEAEVQDRRAPPSAPDRLTLSKGTAASAAKPGNDDQLARTREQRDSATRVAELAKNVKELNELRGAAAGTAASAAKPGVPVAGLALPGAASAAAEAPAAKAASVPAPAAVAAASAASASVASASAAADSAAVVAAAVPASAAASEPVAQASAPVTVAAASAATAAPDPAASAAPPVPAPQTASDDWMSDLLGNPWLLPLGGVLVALLAGFGFYRLRQSKRDGGETSFLESRLQPDSFFGASGGQRVDTRDATGVPSSMSYSLSQLDAIGDVDPVAEADVYLAYGRDLQAEEILKEAMRSNPERMAIRLKLLEVYAKRRDTKGFELLATQLHALTGGEGEDWAKAQELGAAIDPEHPLYRPGGRPASPALAGNALDMVSASTMPATLLPSPSRFDEQRSEFRSEPAVDLDLDALESGVGAFASAPVPFEVSAAPAPFDAPASSQFEPSALPADRDAPGFDLPLDLGAADAEPASSPSLEDPSSFDFELPDLSLDTPGDAAPGPVAADADDGLFELPAVSEVGEVSELDEAGEALERKLELAEEFRQIGDFEGARDLLEEVMAQTDGSLNVKARRMLEEIG